MIKKWTYDKAGVNIDLADEAKQDPLTSRGSHHFDFTQYKARNTNRFEEARPYPDG